MSVFREGAEKCVQSDIWKLNNPALFNFNHLHNLPFHSVHPEFSKIWNEVNLLKLPHCKQKLQTRIARSDGPAGDDNDDDDDDQDDDDDDDQYKDLE